MSVAPSELDSFCLMHYQHHAPDGAKAVNSVGGTQIRHLLFEGSERPGQATTRGTLATSDLLLTTQRNRNVDPMDLFPGSVLVR